MFICVHLWTIFLKTPYVSRLSRLTKMTDFDFDKSLNQPPILESYNLFASDLSLQTAVEANGGAWNNERAHTFGEILGKAETLELGNLANKNTPVLKTHDRFGNRFDIVEYHPAYHALMRIALENETHSAQRGQAKNRGNMWRVRFSRI